MLLVEKIPAKVKKKDVIRVAAYCRVSKNVEEQLSSLNTQIMYFRGLKNKENKIDLVDVYYDYGKSGLRKQGRASYQKMINDGLKGKFDYIITKSVSRFARNTLDILMDIRKLREHNVYVYFDKEKIDTSKPDYELILIIYSALAQEDSISTSKNVKWGIRNKMKRGELPVKTVYGYKKIKDDLIIDEDKAIVVKLIFQEYLRGSTLKQIKEILEDLNIKSPSGNDKWDCKTINKILSNEKYMGDVIQQKTFVSDTLTGKRETNIGQLEKVHILNNHDAIISKEDFEKVQQLKSRRSRYIIDENGNKVIRHNQYSSKSIYSNLLVCGYCGAPYRRRTERGKVVYRCATRMDKGRSECPNSITLEEDNLNEITNHKISLSNYTKSKFFEKVKQIEVIQDECKFVFIDDKSNFDLCYNLEE